MRLPPCRLLTILAVPYHYGPKTVGWIRVEVGRKPGPKLPRLLRRESAAIKLWAKHDLHR